VDTWLSGAKKGERTPSEELLLEPGIVLRDHEVQLRRGADPAIDLSLSLRVAAVSAELDRPVSPSTLTRLARRSVIPEGTWPPNVLQAFVRLLAAGRPAIGAIEALDHHGVWLRYLPEWEPVRNRPQRNAYHRFTVDRHLLEAVANAAAMQSSVRRPDLLLLGTFMHDIGKGRGGDHTEIGIEVASKLAARMGLAPEDVESVVQMVRHHLLLPDVATRRDLDDPATAAGVAAAVGDVDTLELLAALTEADSLATGQAAWGRWKAGLVARLVEQVSQILEGTPPPSSRRAALSDSERALLSSRKLSVSVSDTDTDGRVMVAAPDASGLLATVSGVLTLSGANVRAATTISDEESGMALLRFEVTPAFDRLPDWPKVQADLEAALDGRIDVEARLVDRQARYSRFALSTSAHTPDVRVLIDNDSSATSTIVEVRAPDRGPVLYRVARALTSTGVSITCALVSTVGAEAIDVFYVHNGKEGRVLDPTLLTHIETAVLEAL
jgi:[protein-PII] uridylyltransferase